MRAPISERYNIDEKETPQSWKETGLRSFYNGTDGEKQQKKGQASAFFVSLAGRRAGKQRGSAGQKKNPSATPAQHIGGVVYK